MIGSNAVVVAVISAALHMSGSCTQGPCLSVHTDPLTHQIIITATQNTPGSSTATSPKPTPSAPKSTPAKATPAKATPAKPAPVLIKPIPIPSKSATASAKPRPYTPRPYTPRPYVYRYRPRIKPTPTPTPALVEAVNLSDQISQLIPGNHLLYQPTIDPLSGVPIYFWSDAGDLFSLATAILGVGVSVALTPSFAWDFGDGSHLTVDSPGGPYPNSKVVHTYSRPGSYEVALAISWGGTWSSQGAVLPVLGGAIVQNLSAELVIAPGPTEFTG